MTRRVLVTAIALIALVTMLAGLPGGLTAQGKVVKIGLSLPLTGADADGADAILKGAQMAIAEINAKGGAGGYKLEAVVFDSATPAAGQYDPAQAATNYKKFIADALVLAAVGPNMSGEGKAISPILSEADMATITPSSTNPDITDPKFQSQYRPKGKAVYFRTVTTDAYQGPNMANYLFHSQKVKNVYVLDDGGAFGVGIADSFQKRATDARGEDPRPRPARSRRKPTTRPSSPRSRASTRTRSTTAASCRRGQARHAGLRGDAEGHQGGLGRGLRPLVAEAVGQGVGRGLVLLAGLAGAGDLPEARGVGDQVQDRDEARAHQLRDHFLQRGAGDRRRGRAHGRRQQAARPAAALRDAIQATKLDSIQGPIAFDANGDILTRTVSIYQWRDGEIKYVGVAPEK